MPNYTEAQIEFIARTAALRGFQRGMDWKGAQTDAYTSVTVAELKASEDAIVAELRAEGKIPCWE